MFQRTTIGLLAALILLTEASAQSLPIKPPGGPGESFYLFQPQAAGIYIADGLTGWGFSIDIQKGVLFAAIFGYDESGDEAFLTLQSTGRPTQSGEASGAALDFSGSVFLTDNNGQRSTEVGTFSIRLFAATGKTFTPQLGPQKALLTIDSPFLQADELSLRRFGFKDEDALSVVDGDVWVFAQSEALPSAAQISSGSLLAEQNWQLGFGETRMNVGRQPPGFLDVEQIESAFPGLQLDGFDYLLAEGLSNELQGIFLLLEDTPSQTLNSEIYMLVLADTRFPDEQLLFLLVGSHTQLFGVANLNRNGTVVDQAGVLASGTPIGVAVPSLITIPE